MSTNNVAFAFGTINLNNRRGRRAQLTDLKEAIAFAVAKLHTDAIVLAVQEATSRLEVAGFTTIQPNRNGNARTPAGEAILVSDRLRVRDAGSVLAIDGEQVSTHQDPIRDRFHPFALVDTPLGRVKFLSNHDAPRDYDRAIRIRSRQQLAGLTHGQDKWLAGGDFNDRRPAANFGVGKHLAGARIDLLYGSDFMADHAGTRRRLKFRHRPDNHPAVFRAFKKAA